MGTRFEHLLAALAILNRGGRRRSLAEVGSLVHLSPGRAQRVFAGFVGESPGKYQVRTRLDRAGAELLATDRSIADVAFNNGFGSHEGFTRSFHARFGVSPGNTGLGPAAGRPPNEQPPTRPRRVSGCTGSPSTRRHPTSAANEQRRV